MDELVELSEVSEELDEVSLLESDCEDESESEGSGSGLDLDLLDFFDRLGLGVFGLMSVKVVRNDMVSGKDDTDDVSSKLVFFFCFWCMASFGLRGFCCVLFGSYCMNERLGHRNQY